MKPHSESAASPSALDVLRGYVERAADWGDAGVGRGEAMDADRAEGMRALDEIQALLEQRRTGSLLIRTGNEDARVAPAAEPIYADPYTRMQWLRERLPSDQFLADVRAVVAYHWSGLPERRPDESVWARLDAVLFDDESQEREPPDYEARP